MTGFLKLLLILGLVSFFSYTFYIEPNAADDPAGAVSRSAQRLATICDRNREECEFVGDVGEGIGQAVGIGWKLATGQGRLVYVANDGSTYDSAVPGPSADATQQGGNSTYRLPRLPKLFGDNQSTGAYHRSEDGRSYQNTYAHGHRPAGLNNEPAEGTSPNTLGDLIRSTQLFGTRKSGNDHDGSGYRNSSSTMGPHQHDGDSHHCH